VFEVHLDTDRLGEGDNDGNLMQPANNDKLNPFYTKEEEDEFEALENMEEEEDSEGEVEEIIRSFRF